MNLEHKTYTSEQLKLAHDLITKVTKEQNWVGWQYPPYEALKETYETRPTFDPENRHFAYRDGKLVGFLASAKEREQEGTVIGSIQYPFIENQDPDVEKMLMKKAIKTLKMKGVDIIQTRWRPGWGDEEFFKRHNYGERIIMAKGAQIPFKTYDLSDFKNTAGVREADAVKDREVIIRAFKTEMPQTEEEIGQIIDQWPTQENLLTNAIIRDGDELIAHSMVYINQNNKNAFMTAISIYKEGKEDLREQVFKYIMQKLQASDREVVNFNLTEAFFEGLPFYEKMGLEFNDFYRYDLNLKEL
ncbi:MAG: hypothetical protein INQ03_13620 [Candidatus Heimdallarchaeota archaeon]|nr:hypothetical protein [Candidatus Heimdallarchaeota archaeon]